MVGITNHTKRSTSLPFQSVDGFPAALKHNHDLSIPFRKAAILFSQLINIVPAKNGTQ